MTGDLSLRSDRALLPEGEAPATVHVVDGKITAIDHAEPGDGGEVIDLGELVLMPGLVDSHVHVNEPGRTEWEGFVSATRAAAAGGVTTIVDMPLNCIPPTTSVAALDEKGLAAEGRCQVDVAFWGGIVPGNAAALAPLADAGVCGFKAFLADSGVPEFPPVTIAQLDEAMTVLAGRETPVLVHAELPGPLDEAAAGLIGRDPRRYATWLASRPERAETAAIEAAIALAERHGVAVHVLHLSSADGLAPLRAAKERGSPVTAETCPHYLALAAEDIPDGATAHKCAPPIRDRENAERLWGALADGTLDLIASDHSPSPPERKHLDDGDFVAAWGGIASLQLTLPVVWTHAAERGVALSTVARWMSERPAVLAGLTSKGALAPGRDADLVAFDPGAVWTVDADALEHRHPVTPYDGHTLRGAVRATWVRGRQVYADGVHLGRPATDTGAQRRAGPAFWAAPPPGQLLSRRVSRGAA